MCDQLQSERMWNIILACQLLYPMFFSLCSLFFWLTMGLILYFLFPPLSWKQRTSLDSVWDTSGGQRWIVPRTPCGQLRLFSFGNQVKKIFSWSSNRLICPCAVFLNFYTLVGFWFWGGVFFVVFLLGIWVNESSSCCFRQSFTLDSHLNA